ncbi:MULTISPECIES: hypothetical protein [Comamonas]|uniref:Uncharacterized protein n=1 Tax=Comamonas testosteroni TK102 TaxID=1392005 RepID=A0A076PQS8_COMTE|nr:MULTISPECIES: hypothetical protein [Comamonas]AIJ45767.1 hypothetical protein O987_08105 [Comamonas testosteroni TK102]MPS87134.1 hypothetical protein [Comamonas sp.]MPT13026.1 hypothetical protein [Comamonas sp.]
MAANSQVRKYFEALDRLRARGTPINNDTVALEAGSGRGSIKKSRLGHADLISAIEQAAQEQKQEKLPLDPIKHLQDQLKSLRILLDNSLEREICLLDEVFKLREENLQLKQGKLFVVPIKTS